MVNIRTDTHAQPLVDAVRWDEGRDRKLLMPMGFLVTESGEDLLDLGDGEQYYTTPGHIVGGLEGLIARRIAAAWNATRHRTLEELESTAKAMEFEDV